MAISSRKHEPGVEIRTTCSTAGPMFVHVKDDKVVRVEPMQFDPSEVKSWEVDVNGKAYAPPLIHPLLPWGTASKQLIYSENRVKYPMKRVDWDPNGNRNAAMRGISGYERISWDEAYDLMTKEMRRVIDTYGPSACAYSFSAHPEWGNIHYFFSDLFRFWHMIGGTYREPTAISWEGWCAGAPFLWGNWMSHGIPAAPDSLQDISENSELIVLWGTDTLFHNTYNGVDTARVWKYWQELGKKIVVIDPLLNETGLFIADKWIQIRPGTDGALACAIMYQWVIDGTYDQDYLDTHAIGFDEAHLPEGAPAGSSFKVYLEGEDDGQPKTAAWAAEITGIPERVIVALAREWAAKPTSLWGLYSGACRRTYAHEYARLVGILNVMQGIGKPGVNILSPAVCLSGPYDGMRQVGPLGYVDGGMNAILENYAYNTTPQRSITFTKFLDCVENPPQKWNGGHLDNLNAQEWWEPIEYPAPGCSEVHLLWQRGSSNNNAPNRKNDLQAYRNDKIETYIMCAPWFDRECHYADLVLPITTVFEHQDISEPSSVGRYLAAAYIGLRSAVYHQQVVQPIGESKTDMEICDELSRRLGYGDIYMEGNDEDDLMRLCYDKCEIPLSFDEFKTKGYYVWPFLDDYQPTRQFGAFYEDPENNPIDTPSGKFEIFSTQLFEKYGMDNPDITPVPHYIPEREGYWDVEAKAKHPYQLLMAHPKFRFHGKYNDCTWLTENYKVIGDDGYPYEPFYLNRNEAAKHGLVDGDIVRVHNDRGQVLAAVQVTDRLMDGVVWLMYGAWNDHLSTEIGALDRSGDANQLTNAGPMSCHHVGGAFNSTLVSFEKVDIDELRVKYPEGFAGKYATWNKEG